MIVGEEDKPSIDTLVHFGVLGMKWGHRTKAGPSQIHGARKRVAKDNIAFEAQKIKVGQQKKNSRAHVTESKKLAVMKADRLRNPDRVISTRMTRGEKFAALALSVLAAPVALPVAVGAIGVTSAKSRTRERKLDRAPELSKKK